MNFDCRTCGACCLAPSGAGQYVRLDDEDLARLEDAERERFVVRESETSSHPFAWLETRETDDELVCAALDGVPGAACSCVIYPRRPAICRRFEMSSPECLLARANLDLPIDP